MLKVVMVIVWFLLGSAFVLFVGKQGIHEFDPHLKMSQAMMDLDYEEKLSKLFEHLPHADNGLLIHVGSGKSCFCEVLAESHIKSLNKFSEKEGLTSHSVTIEELPELASFIPSTPAVIYMDEDRQIKYVGPYSQGAGCFSASGLVDDAIKATLGLKNSQSILVNEASGCYCEI
ncbi:DUF6436 domain-containing protein [Glaciecola sp. 1036]|uniref:DUF6436 domain-containing protein n=1 Tax=Alteromonadaceae TaxID=72275 RepID=UPI003D094AE7